MPIVNENIKNENCENCVNCVNCKNCVNCINCVNCVNCKDCVNCKNCKNCVNCEDVDKSIECLNCIYAYGCKNCSYSYIIYECRNCELIRFYCYSSNICLSPRKSSPYGHHNINMNLKNYEIYNNNKEYLFNLMAKKFDLFDDICHEMFKNIDVIYYDDTVREMWREDESENCTSFLEWHNEICCQ